MDQPAKRKCFIIITTHQLINEADIIGNKYIFWFMPINSKWPNTDMLLKRKREAFLILTSISAARPAMKARR